MIKLFAAAMFAATVFAAPAAAHDEHAAHAEPAANARLNLDTPIEAIVADAAGKAVLDANMPGITEHEHYEGFKQMSLRQVASYAPDKLTPELLAKVETGLAAVK